MSQTDIPSGNNYVTFVIAWWKWRETNISVPVKEIIKRTITFRVIRFRGTKTITDSDKGFPDLQLDIQPRQIFSIPCFQRKNNHVPVSYRFVNRLIIRFRLVLSFFFESFFLGNVFRNSIFMEQISSSPDAKGTKSWIDAIFVILRLYRSKVDRAIFLRWLFTSFSNWN